MAKSDPSGPTVNFHADRLEVEAKQGNKPPTEVTVSNGDDRGSGVDFSATVQDGKLTLGQEATRDPRAGTEEAQQSLSFLDDPLDLMLKGSLDSSLVGSSMKCEPEDGTYVEVGSKGKHTKRKSSNLKMARATVFIGYTGGDEMLSNLMFATDMTEKSVGDEPAGPRPPPVNAVMVCRHPPPTASI